MKDEEFAFPIIAYSTDESTGKGTTYEVYGGMTLRDYFAAKALPTIYTVIHKECEARGWPEGWRNGIANSAYRMADAMLKEREK